MDGGCAVSYVWVVPEVVAGAARDVAGVGSMVGTANAAAAAWITQVAAAAGDEVSVQIAALFGAYARQYQELSVQAAGFHQRFVQGLGVGAGWYAGAEAASAEQLVWGWVNAPWEAFWASDYW